MRLALIALALSASTAAQAFEPTNKFWSPGLQVPDEPETEPEKETRLLYNPCFGFDKKEPTVAYCRRHIRGVQRFIDKQERRYLKTGMGYNVGSSLVGCANYCRERYPKLPEVNHGAFWATGECKVKTETMCFK